jgi:hypothetical protein
MRIVDSGPNGLHRAMNFVRAAENSKTGSNVASVGQTRGPKFFMFLLCGLMGVTVDFRLDFYLPLCPELPDACSTVKRPHSVYKPGEVQVYILLRWEIT